MEPIFQVETAHDREAYRNLITVHYMFHEKTPIGALYIFGVMLGAAVWWMVSDGQTTTVRAIGAGLMTLALFWLATPHIDKFCAGQVCARMLERAIKGAKKGGSYGLPTRARFYEDSLDVSDQAGTVKAAYSEITDLVETEGYYLVFLRGTQCVLVPKGGFIQGEASDFRPFIEAVSGRTMREFQIPGGVGWPK